MYCMVVTTVKNQEEAQQIADALVNEQLAACVQLIEGVLSTFMWKGELFTEEEVILFIKSRKDVFKDVEKRILSLHSYDVPEIISLPIDHLHGAYAAWLNQSVKKGAG